jgi:hypothetical protein
MPPRMKCFSPSESPTIVLAGREILAVAGDPGGGGGGGGAAGGTERVAAGTAGV